MMDRVPDCVPMFWIGGTPGSGKSTAARRLAQELDLAVHPIDAFTHDHRARLGRLGRPLEETLADGPEVAADEFERISARRVPVVVADVRAARVGDVPTLVEGPQLHPSAVAEHRPLGSVWLLTTPERTRAAREGRLVEDDDSGRARVAALVERDRVLGSRLAAAAAGLARIDVPTDVVWDEVTAAVRATLTTALAVNPRLEAGAELTARRRHENDVVRRQLAAIERETGLLRPAFPYACTCGRSGCTDQVWLTTADYRS